MKKLRSPKSDPQRAALCELEKEINGHADGHTASLHHLRRIAKEVCDYYKVPVVPVKIVKRSSRYMSEWGWTLHDEGFDNHIIYLHKAACGQNALTLIHEIAHYVTDLCYEDHETHGREFCAIYMHLLHRWKLLPQDAFRVMARRWKIRIARDYLPSTLSPRP